VTQTTNLLPVVRGHWHCPTCLLAIILTGAKRDDCTVAECGQETTKGGAK
jgi:hypothetical protein